MEVHKSGKCYFCEKRVSSTHYCYGCGAYICFKCEHPNPPMGRKHNPEDHKEKKE